MTFAEVRFMCQLREIELGSRVERQPRLLTEHMGIDFALLLLVVLEGVDLGGAV